MSKKLGRNSPCHCGSGKKYKKCCLIQDKNKAQIEQNPDLLYEDIEEDFVEDDEIDDEHKDNSNHFANEYYSLEGDEIKKPEIAPLPEITAEQEQLVNDWEEKYVTIKDPDEFLSHLTQFLQQHPTLVPHLGLEDEALFRLESMLLQHEQGNKYIEVLLDIRQKFPDVYMKNYAYYDRALIVYHICQGEIEQAEQFMDNFKKYPDNEPDILFSLIDFLCVTNQQNILSELLKEIYLKVFYSKNIFGGGDILEPFLWACYYIPELERSYDKKSMLSLSKAFKNMMIDFKDEYYQPEFLYDKLNEITEKIEQPLDEKFKSTKNTMEFYHQIGMNFIGWIHKEKNVPWLTAYYYHALIVKYFHVSIPENKRPKKPFLFIQSHFDKTLAQMSRQLLSLNATKALSSFRAFHEFADYLLAHQAISEKEAKALQSWCKTFNIKLLPSLLDNQFEAQYFLAGYEALPQTLTTANDQSQPLHPIP